MKKCFSMSIGELFDYENRLRQDYLINAPNLIRRSEVITARDVMAGNDVVIFGSETLRAYRPHSGRVPTALVVECDLDGQEFLDFRDAVAAVKGVPCENTPLD